MAAMANERYCVIGAGSWGTALAKLLAEGGRDVTLWAREPEVASGINAEHKNPLFLTAAKLPENVTATGDLPAAVDGADGTVIVVPSAFFRDVVTPVSSLFGKSGFIVTATKGIEDETFKTPSQILEDVLPPLLRHRIGALSGPSFAAEVAQRHPTAVAIAARDIEFATELQKIFSGETFRVYATDDLVGVELAGAIKNVLAIAAGTAAGLGFGSNTLAAIITRGLAEMNRLAVKMGANPLTMLGLAGVGDLVLTCGGPLSRNRTVGEKLGRGMKLADVLGETKMVAEGVRNARSVHNLSLKAGIEMPISSTVYRMLYEDLPPKETVGALMGRQLRKEREFDGERRGRRA